jgi:hypothetical protein
MATYNEVKQRRIIEMVGLTYGEIQNSHKSKNVNVKSDVEFADLSGNNDYNRLDTKYEWELDGLDYSAIEQSKRTINGTAAIDRTAPSGHHNTYTFIRRRTNAEVEGLFYHAIEVSFRDKTIQGTMRMVRPRKLYRQPLQLFKKYSNTLEV